MKPCPHYTFVLTRCVSMPLLHFYSFSVHSCYAFPPLALSWLHASVTLPAIPSLLHVTILSYQLSLPPTTLIGSLAFYKPCFYKPHPLFMEGVINEYTYSWFNVTILWGRRWLASHSPFPKPHRFISRMPLLSPSLAKLPTQRRRSSSLLHPS